jgi:hypothetical protein
MDGIEWSATHILGDRVAETPAEYVVARPTVYLDTTIPSYLTCWPSRNAVRLNRSVTAVSEPDLDAYNEDARRRALVLGFSAETFVLTAEEVKAVAEELRAPLPYYTREPRDD